MLFSSIDNLCKQYGIKEDGSITNDLLDNYNYSAFFNEENPLFTNDI